MFGYQLCYNRISYPVSLYDNYKPKDKQKVLYRLNKNIIGETDTVFHVCTYEDKTTSLCLGTYENKDVYIMHCAEAVSWRDLAA